MTAGMPAHLLHFSKDKKPVVVWNTAALQPALHPLLRQRPGQGVRGATTRGRASLLDTWRQFGARLSVLGGEPHPA
jgi:hypothetical protein